MDNLKDIKKIVESLDYGDKLMLFGMVTITLIRLLDEETKRHEKKGEFKNE